MPEHDAFKERERAFEEGYFRAQDARLLETLRQRATLDEVALALREKLHVDDPDLLARIQDLGLTIEAAPAFLLAPLVQVAWAEGSVTPAEREMVLTLAASRGIAADAPAGLQLSRWLDERPEPRVFALAIAAIQVGLSVLPAADRDERVRSFVEECKRVARASGGLAAVFGLGGMVSGSEAEVLDVLAAQLREPGPSL